MFILEIILVGLIITYGLFFKNFIIKVLKNKKILKTKMGKSAIIVLSISAFILMLCTTFIVNDYENFFTLLLFAILMTYFYRVVMKDCPSLKNPILVLKYGSIILVVFAFILGFVVIISGGL